jgi:hypothetical protein
MLIGWLLVMSHETLQTRYAAKEILPRLVGAMVVANTSLWLIGKAIEIANAISVAVMGQGVQAAGVVKTLIAVIVADIATDGIFTILLGLIAATMAVALLVTWFIRLAGVVLLAAGAPMALICHALPATDPLARLWWRALAACLGMQVTQSLVLIAAVKVFFAGDGLDLATSMNVSGGQKALVDLLICVALFYILLKIPAWARQWVFGNRHSTAYRMVRSILIYRGLQAVGIAGTGGAGALAGLARRGGLGGLGGRGGLRPGRGGPSGGPGGSGGGGEGVGPVGPRGGPRRGGGGGRGAGTGTGGGAGGRARPRAAWPSKPTTTSIGSAISEGGRRTVSGQASRRTTAGPGRARQLALPLDLPRRPRARQLALPLSTGGSTGGRARAAAGLPDPRTASTRPAGPVAGRRGRAQLPLPLGRLSPPRPAQLRLPLTMPAGSPPAGGAPPTPATAPAAAPAAGTAAGRATGTGRQLSLPLGLPRARPVQLRLPFPAPASRRRRGDQR